MKYCIKIQIAIILFFWAHVASASVPWLIHEPYWQYNPIQLRAYAKRIYKTISPYLIGAEQLDRTNGKILMGDEWIKIRKETQFGRVLPTIFLKEVLTRLGDKAKAVPRIFLLPQKDANIEFNFLLPHFEMKCDSGHNCIQVESDSFEIFKECIEGEGIVGDKSFFPFGHTDFNAKQIITSRKDGKKYLIDTKEEKNFFLPALSPYKDGFATYWLFSIGRKIPQHMEQFEAWQLRERARMIASSDSIYGPAKSNTVDLGPTKDIDLEGVDALDYAAEVFDDSKEHERYFSVPRDNVARYLYLGRVDLLKQLADDYSEMPLTGITVPYRDDYRAYELNPVQFALSTSSFTHPEILAILKIFSKEKEYFKNAADIDSDVDKWPLNLALRTGDREIFSLVAENGADINGKVGPRAILNRAAEQLITNMANEGLEAIFSKILSESNQANIKEALVDLLNNVKEFRQEKIAIANRLIKRLSTIDQEVMEKIFELGDKSIIESILDSHFDYENLLLIAMKKIQDPSHDYLRLAKGDKTPIDYFWYDLVKKILAQKSKYPEADVAIDKAMVDATVNSKVVILDEMLKYRPINAPHMQQVIKELKETPHSKDMLMENAIKQGSALVIQFLGENGIPVSISQIRESLRISKNDAVIDALIKAKYIDLYDALNEAIDYGDRDAAKKFLLALHDKGLAVSSVNYQKIFQSDFTELKKMAEELAKTSTALAAPALMKKWEIEKIVRDQDLKTLNYLIDQGINLGEILTNVVHHIIFAKDNKITIGNDWWNLLDKLKIKDLPAQSLDDALASALINSRTVIVELFVNQLKKIDEIPKQDQRVRAVIKQNIRSQYMNDHYFEDALSTGNIDLVKIYLEQGMLVKPRHFISIPAGNSAEQLKNLLFEAMKKQG